MDSRDFEELLEARYSVRSFSDEPVSEEQLDAILQAARLSPTARNNQPVRLCVVQSAEGLAKIDECTKCRYGAPTVIIGAFDTKVSSKGLGFEAGDFGNVDASIALTNMANAATAAGLGSCWVGAYDPQAVRERFAVPEDYALVDLLMIGHPAPDAEPSPRHAEREPIEAFVARESF